MPRDIAYIAIILLLVVMLLTSNGRMTKQQYAHEDGLKMCETATRILENQVKDLRIVVNKANEERVRLLGLTKTQTRRLD